jgi:hypothetical protein
MNSSSSSCRALILRLINDKDDVNRWREERRNKYPTSANLNRKVKVYASGLSGDLLAWVLILVCNQSSTRLKIRRITRRLELSLTKNCRSGAR